MDKKKIDRINELGRLSKTRELTEEEKMSKRLSEKSTLHM